MKKLKYSDVYNDFYKFFYFKFLDNHSFFPFSNRHELFAAFYDVINSQHGIAVSEIHSFRRVIVKALRAASYDFYKENIKCRN